MNARLKNLSEQVVVITGATSGIGLVTARMAAKRGARLVLVARNEPALQALANELAGQGHETMHVAADVADEARMREVGRVALERFGHVDTWVNNAGVSVFGRLDQVPSADHRRLFETNFWGVVNGSLAALPLLKRQGGALINVGSEVSDAAIPLQGMYSASKHAVKGFTDALRVELEAEGAPVSVTLIKPAAIDTMFIPHAKNCMEVEPKLPAPVYAPELVADAILFAAEHPRRDIFVGGAAKLMAAGAYHVPKAMDRYRAGAGIRSQRSDRPADVDQPGALHVPGAALRERGSHHGHVCQSSLYTQAVTRPASTLAAALLVASAIAGAWWYARERDVWRRLDARLATLSRTGRYGLRMG